METENMLDRLAVKPNTGTGYDFMLARMQAPTGRKVRTLQKRIDAHARMVAARTARRVARLEALEAAEARYAA